MHFFPQMHPGLFLVRRFTGADLFMRSGECCTSSRRHTETHLFMLFTGCIERKKKKSCPGCFPGSHLCQRHAAVLLQGGEKEKEPRRRPQTSRPAEKTDARRVFMQFPAASFHRKQRNRRSQIRFICFLLTHVPRQYNRRFHPTDTII